MTQKTVKYQFKVTRRLVIRRNKTNWTFEKKKLVVMHLWPSMMYVAIKIAHICRITHFDMQADISACPFFKDWWRRPRPSGVERWERFPAADGDKGNLIAFLASGAYALGVSVALK